jgi:predicted nucleotidyltransferase
MKSIFQQNYQKIRDQYGNIIDALRKTGKELEVKFILIGAQSRDVWSSHLEMNKRETKDIDYSVQLKEFSDWQKLSEYLISEFGAEQDPELPYRFKLYDQIFDIIPFGGFVQNDEVVLGDNSMKLSVVGLKEVSEKGTEVIENYCIVSLPGLCILKLISYSERPADRKRDFEDFEFLLSNLMDIYGDSIFDDEYFLERMGGNIDIEILCAGKLGTEMIEIINENDHLLTQIIDVLAKELHGRQYDAVDQEYRNEKQDSLEDITKYRLLAELRRTIDTNY